MPIAFEALPYGMRDIHVYPLTGETPGAAVDLPNSRVMTFDEAEAFDELRGADNLVALHGKGPAVDWEMEGGGVPFAVIQVLFGGVVATTGTTPNQVQTYTKKITDVRPYFKAEGQAISDSGGDFHVTLYRCRATGNLKGEMKDGAFWLTNAKGKALGRSSDGMLYTFTQNETPVAIV